MIGRRKMDEKKIIESKAKMPVFIPLFFVGLGIILCYLAATIGWWGGDMATTLLYLFGALSIIIAIILTLSVAKCQIHVTDKRIYGTAAFGKRVDLPLDSVSAVGTSLFKGIAVATSSGRISFWAIQNRNDIHSALSNLLIERQSKTSAKSEYITQSNADELKKYKDLLDSGIITQEEFDAKKKQLLGL